MVGAESARLVPVVPPTALNVALVLLSFAVVIELQMAYGPVDMVQITSTR